MEELPPGWESDYDGRRWFYTYKPTGNVQYHFPSEGDEFPDFVDASLPPPGLAPEERLESTKQLRRQGSQGVSPGKAKGASGLLSPGRYGRGHDASNAEYGGSFKGTRYTLSATARPVSDLWEGEQDEGGGEEEGQEIFQPESFMYLGPGSYQNISPLGEDDQEEETARRLVVGGSNRAVNRVSPLASEKTTPMAGKSEMSQETAEGTAERPVVPEISIDRATIAEIDNDETVVPESCNERATLPSPSSNTAVIAEMEAPLKPQIIATIDVEAAVMLDGTEMPLELPVDDTALRVDPVGTVAEMASEHTPQSMAELEPVEIAGPDLVLPLQKMTVVEEVSELDGDEKRIAATPTRSKTLTVETSHGPTPITRRLAPEPRSPAYQPYDPAFKKVMAQGNTENQARTSASPPLQRDGSLMMGRDSGSSSSGDPVTSQTASGQSRDSPREEAEVLTHAPSVLKPAGRKGSDEGAPSPVTRTSTQKRIVRKSLPSYINGGLPFSHPTVLRPNGTTLPMSRNQIEEQHGGEVQRSTKDIGSAPEINGQRTAAAPAGYPHPRSQQGPNEALQESLPYPLSPTLAGASISQDSSGHKASISSPVNKLPGEVSPLEPSETGSAVAEQIPIPASLNPYHQLPEQASSPQLIPQRHGPHGYRRSSMPTHMQTAQTVNSQQHNILMQSQQGHGISPLHSGRPGFNVFDSNTHPNLQRSHTVHNMQDTSGSEAAIATIQEEVRDETNSQASPFPNSINSISEASDAHSTTPNSSPNTPQSIGPPGDVNVPQRPGPSYQISMQHQELLEEQYGAKANVRLSLHGSPVSPVLSQRQPPQHFAIQAPQTTVGPHRSLSMGGQPVPPGIEAAVKVKDKSKRWTNWFKSPPKPQMVAQHSTVAGYQPPAQGGPPLNGVLQPAMNPQQINGPPRNTIPPQNTPFVQMVPRPSNHPHQMVPQQNMPYQQNVGPNGLSQHLPGQPQNGVPPKAWQQQNLQPQNGFIAQPQPFQGQPYRQMPAPMSRQNNGPPMPQMQMQMHPGSTVPMPRPYQAPQSQPTPGQQHPGPQPWQQPYQFGPRQGPPLMMPSPLRGIAQQTQNIHTHPAPPNPPAPPQVPNLLRKAAPPSRPQPNSPQSPPVQMIPQHLPPMQQQAAGMLLPRPSYQQMTNAHPAPLFSGPQGPRYPQGPANQGNANTSPPAWPAQPIYAHVQQK